MSNPTKVFKVELVTGTFIVSDVTESVQSSTGEGIPSYVSGAVVAAGSARNVADTIKEKLEELTSKSAKPYAASTEGGAR